MLYSLGKNRVEKSIGIVLKSYQPQKSKLTILDRDSGKITAVPNRSDIRHGSLIAYFKRTQDHLSFIYAIDIIDMPFALAEKDIIFVHHVLEVCYYFIPQASQAQQVFIALLRLYEIPTILSTPALKKIFILQLFFLLGVYPESEGFRSAMMHELVTTSIDFLASRPLHLSIEQELDVWLMASIRTHPCSAYFKTLNFLLMNKAI